MARKVITISVNDGGEEKSFRLTQMPATKLEAWIARALLLVGHTDIDPAAFAGGEEAAAAAGIKALSGVSYEQAKPLYDELLGCCEVMIGDHFEALSISNADVHIEDVKTLFKLRMEAAKLNFSFFDFGALSKSMSQKMTAAGISATPMSPA
ncbi:MAG TPA: hypothetical protein VNV36_05210 [Pseudomonas sp.]|uniref:hypothetical protein n=1 Tax=Pseudomonas sp. TaxID=306 RepID=UPI002C69BE0F|nr:hypothetical protein [Pseudomonas sp.]HWH86160.1 hypothetical protein [Pseudomonas sp.]